MKLQCGAPPAPKIGASVTFTHYWWDTQHQAQDPPRSASQLPLALSARARVCESKLTQPLAPSIPFLSVYMYVCVYVCMYYLETPPAFPCLSPRPPCFFGTPIWFPQNAKGPSHSPIKPIQEPGQDPRSLPPLRAAGGLGLTAPVPPKFPGAPLNGQLIAWRVGVEWYMHFTRRETCRGRNITEPPAPA